MSVRVLAALRPFSETLHGRPSLQFVVIASIALFWLVLALTAYLLLLRTYHHFWALWRARRRKVFEPAVEKVLLEEPFEDVLAAFQPLLPGDEEAAQAVMTEAMTHLLGPPFETLRTAARRLGFVELNLSRLQSTRRHIRGRAMEILGIMHVAESRGALIRAAYEERLDLKLVALRSLALIKDPKDLVHFVAVARRLSPAMLVRLASLMMEFGPSAKPYIVELISQHPAAFPERAMKLLLAEIAFNEEPT